MATATRSIFRLPPARRPGQIASVVEAALARPDADKLLKEHKQDADKAARDSEGITVDSGPQEWPSQICPSCGPTPRNRWSLSMP